jgi:alkylation response protein AidB-like acyl-CoA dehydrogenase
MDFEYDEGERARARELGKSMIADSVVERDRAAGWSAEAVRALGSEGLFDTNCPIVLSQRLIGLAEGSGDAGLSLAWAAHTITCMLPIEQFGTSALCARLLPALASGTVIGAFAHAERDGVRAVACASGWRLDGVQPRVINAPVADVFVVRAGTAMFVVERGTAGVQVGARLETSGLRTAMIGELRLSGCELAADSRLGDQHTLAWMRRWQRACLLAPWVGLLGVLVSQCELVARERGASQSLRARLADLGIRQALCERVQARAAWRLTHAGAALEQELAVAAAMLGDSIVTMTGAAQRDFGEPLGVAGPLERLARDAATLVCLLETRAAPRATIAANLFGFMD